MEISLKEADEWRMERRLNQAIQSSEEAMKRLELLSDKPVWISKSTMSRRDYWKKLHSALPSEYKTERTPMKRFKDVEAAPNDPFGVQGVKRSNSDLLKQLAQQMKQLSHRKKDPWKRTNNVSRPVEKPGVRSYYRHMDAELESYHEKWHEKSTQIQEIEDALAKYRITRESGDIERQHDAWVTNRQWGLLVDDVVREELAEIIDELLDEDEDEDSGRELPEEENAVVDDALHGGAMGEVLCQKFNVDVTRNLLQCLLPATWLNDEIVNFWFQMLGERDASLKRPLKSHFFNSFFFAKVSEGGYNFVNVRRWTRKLDLFAMDKIFVPVNVRNVHWCLAVIFMQEKRIQYFDSMMGAGTECLKVLLKYLHDEMQHKKSTEFDATGWELVATTENTPQQGNSHDCGVFTCMFADYLSRDEPLSFSQRDMKFFRKRMVLRMVEGSIPAEEEFDV
ncbi:Aste57867_20353 [Aphanomyces stellatus]|uniref:Aste57867_20353 protein n=1 Tax=Aphanomyces stellatus TaxID=120398 RepID=A0A485LEY0_9STRA|nr:hypothetical protein As57867_020287 [Aphanomyces stellatus]VFT97040.1 Aste57867_20353 [Aphanomyces stellatus]